MVVFMETVDHGCKISWCMDICENIFNRMLRSCSAVWNTTHCGSYIIVFHHFPDFCMAKCLVYADILYILKIFKAMLCWLTYLPTL
jgi:hypothetical protein